MTLNIGEPAQVFLWDLTAFYTIISECGDIGWEICDWEANPIDYTIFSTSLTNGASSLTVDTTDVGKVGRYNIEIEGFYINHKTESKNVERMVVWVIDSECERSAVAAFTPISSQIQVLNAEAYTIDVLWSVEPPSCES